MRSLYLQKHKVVGDEDVAVGFSVVDFFVVVEASLVVETVAGFSAVVALVVA